MQSLNRPYIPEADQIRGIAAVLVFWYHSAHSARTALGGTGWPVASNPFAALLWEGHTGVSLFFVLSGFILSYGTFGKRIDYRDYLLNRVLRIFPLVLVVSMFAISGSTGIDFGQIAASLLLLKNTSAAFSDPAQIAGTVWTVAVEFQFYLITPLLILFAWKIGFRQFLVPLMLVMWVCRVLIVIGAPDHMEMYRISYFTGAARLNQFLIGICLSYLVHNNALAGRWTAKIALPLGSIGVLGLVWLINAGGGITRWAYWRLALPEIEALVWATFLFGFLSAKPLGAGKTACLAINIGKLSFSIYILHYAVQRTFWYTLFPKHLSTVITNEISATLANVALLCFVLGLSYLSFKAIEEPFLKLRKVYLPDNRNNHGAP